MKPRAIGEATLSRTFTGISWEFFIFSKGSVLEAPVVVYVRLGTTQHTRMTLKLPGGRAEQQVICAGLGGYWRVPSVVPVPFLALKGGDGVVPFALKRALIGRIGQTMVSKEGSTGGIRQRATATQPLAVPLLSLPISSERKRRIFEDLVTLNFFSMLISAKHRGEVREKSFEKSHWGRVLHHHCPVTAGRVPLMGREMRSAQQ